MANGVSTKLLTEQNRRRKKAGNETLTAKIMPE
jgi:hypothetical protein